MLPEYVRRPSPVLLSSCGKAIAQQQTQVDALGAIVKLAFVNRQARSFGKGFRQAIFVEEILQGNT